MWHSQWKLWYGSFVINLKIIKIRTNWPHRNCFTCDIHFVQSIMNEFRIFTNKFFSTIHIMNIGMRCSKNPSCLWLKRAFKTYSNGLCQARFDKLRRVILYWKARLDFWQRTTIWFYLKCIRYPERWRIGNFFCHFQVIEIIIECILSTFDSKFEANIF